MTPNQTQLNSILDTLNPRQKDAVTAIDGPVMVIAGPGTGKTQILASRIAYILSTTDTTPESILALTFTESGVKAMRKRLHELIGPAGLDVVVNTFHGFARDIIDTNPEYFSDIFGHNIAGDLDRFKIIKDILDSQHFESLKPPGAPYMYIKDLLGTFGNLKREGVTPPVLKDLVQKEYASLPDKNELSKTALEAQLKRSKKLEELVEFYYLYQHSLTQNRLYDFDDMINLVSAALTQNPSLLLSYQERFQYFHIDEFQDTNNSQLQLFSQLASYWGVKANVFAVGDPNQSIFRFQGANMENILNFQKSYPQANIITLTDNYRSTDHILESAHKLLEAYPPTHEVLKLATQKLQKKSSHLEKESILAVFDNSVSEYLYIKDSIANLISSGVNPCDIAVIVKNNHDAKMPKQVLDKFGIPNQFAGGNDLFQSQSVTRLLELITLIDDITRAIENTQFFSVLSAPYLSFSPKDLMMLFRHSYLNKISLYDLIDSANFKDLGLVADPSAFELFIGKLNAWNQDSYNLPLVSYLERIILHSGLLRYLEGLPDALYELDALRSFFAFITSHDQTLNTVKDLISQVDLIKNQNIRFPLEPFLSSSALTITTAHKSKGLEWDYVFIIQAADNRYGKKFDRQMIPLPEHILETQTKDDLVGEDLRLFYVALTRAKKQLYITYSQSYPDQNGKPSPAIESRFVGLLSLTPINPKITDQKQSLTALLTPTHLPPQNSLAPILEDLTLSASDLNLYLDCHYKYLLEKIYHVPEAKSSALVFGTLIHDSLEYLFRHIKATTKKPALEELLNHFDSKINLANLSPTDLLTRKNQGHSVLTAYFNQLPDTNAVLFLEKYFGGSTAPIYFEGVRLVGKVDQIVQLTDNQVRIIDYKTGSSKSKNDLLGLNKGSNQHILNQLLFYDLLLSNAPHFPYKPVDFVIEFVESPHKDKKLIAHGFSFDANQRQDFKLKLKATVTDIKSANFQKTTDLTVCKLCRFQSHCYPDGLPD